MTTDRHIVERYATAAGAFIVLWIVTGLACALLIQNRLEPWVELLNGATWPTVFYELDAAYRGPPRQGVAFFVVLSLRTLLNLGAVLSAVFAVFWVAAGGLERLAMLQAQAFARMRYAALVAKLLAILDREGVEVSDEIEQELYKAARDFDQSQLGRTAEKYAPGVAEAKAGS